MKVSKIYIGIILIILTKLTQAQSITKKSKKDQNDDYALLILREAPNDNTNKRGNTSNKSIYKEIKDNNEDNKEESNNDNTFGRDIIIRPVDEGK